MPRRIACEEKKACARSDAFEDEGDALADADAHGAESMAAFGALELVKRGGDKASAAGAERMANGDGASVGINVRGVVRKAEVAEDGEGLRGEGFVELDDVHLRKLEASFRENFARGRGRAHAHDARGDACSSGGDDASLCGESVALGRGF